MNITAKGKQPMRKRHVSLPAKLGSMAAVFLLSSCAPTTPGWDAAFGDSVKIAIAQQTLNPGASANTDPVSGIDGRAAREAVNRYHKSFVEKDTQPHAFTIGVSGSK